MDSIDKTAMIYREKQRFKQPAVLISLVISGVATAGLFGFGIYRQIFLGQRFGNHPMSNAGLIIATAVVVCLYLVILFLFGFSTLTTVIGKSGIRFRFFPFQMKDRVIRWEEVETSEIITFNPLRDYGGWGIRSKNGVRVYNVSGNKGLQLKLKSGKIILIGTQLETELTRFLTELKNRS